MFEGHLVAIHITPSKGAALHAVEQVEAVAALCGCSLATVKRRIAAASAALERMLGHG